MPPESIKDDTPAPEDQGVTRSLSKDALSKDSGQDAATLSSLDILLRRQDLTAFAGPAGANGVGSAAGSARPDMQSLLGKRHSTIDCHDRGNKDGAGLSALDMKSFFDKLKDLFAPKGPHEIPDNEPLPKLIINGKEENYPKSKKFSYEDTYGDKKIADPYQWLEDKSNPDTKDWVKKQTELTERYLAGIPEREQLHKRLEQVYNYESRFDMWKQGGKHYVWKQDGLKEQPELCVLDKFTDIPKTILDVNKLSKDGHGIVRDLSLSDDGKYAEFRFSDGGQDRTRNVIYDIVNQKEIDSLPDGVKTTAREKTASTEGTNIPNALLADGSKGEYVLTNKGAQNFKLTFVDAKDGKEKDILPESKDQLIETRMVGGKILAHYLNDACSQLKLFDADGKFIRDVPLPGRGTVKSINGSPDDKEFFFTYSNFTTPHTVYRSDAETGKTEAQFTPKTPFNPNDFETEEKVCKSKDGTPIHMFIVHKKGLELDGKNPTYLHGYGGFRINRTPIFDNGNIPWLQDGGVLVVANLRGGNEYGEKWHQGGMRDKKQNVFDDFISSAEYLVDQKYTSGDRLAIGGRSNGGLLVGATLVQRPDLFAAAIPEVGLFDMLRFPQLGPGAGWQSEYGYPSNPKDFQNFLKYSPLHNLKRGVGLPSILTMTNVNDDRVIPSHSFKFIAAAQRAQGNEKNPVLLYVGQGCGHGPEKYTSQLVDEYSNKWSFLKNSMGLSKR